MNQQEAAEYNRQGLDLVYKGQLQEAIDLFTKAISLNPYFPDPYHNRGETFLLLNRLIEGNTDIQKAKDLRSGKLRNKKPEKSVRMDMEEIDSVYDTLFPGNNQSDGNEPLEFSDSFYDSIFSDDTIETDETWNQIVQPVNETNCFPAILEFISGKRIEAAAVQLFSPTRNDISLIRKDGYAERVIPLAQLGCIRIAGLPQGFVKKKDSSCHIEIIETINDNIFHEAIHPEQDIPNVLLGFSTKENTRFTFSLIPTENIKKRCQQRFLGEILLEKRFIASDMLKRALDEYQQTKSMKLGKILAQKAQIKYSAIEAELEKAQKANVQGLKTGEILLASGLVNEEQVLEALEHQENMQNMMIGQFLIDKGIIQEKEVYIALAEKFRIPFIDLRKQKVSKQILSLLPKKIVLENEILPLAFENEKLTVATPHPDTSFLCEAILKQVNCQNVQFVMAQPTHLRNIIHFLYNKTGLGP